MTVKTIIKAATIASSLKKLMYNIVFTYQQSKSSPEEINLPTVLYTHKCVIHLVETLDIFGQCSLSMPLEQISEPSDFMISRMSFL